MSIIRIKKTKDYTVMSNHHLKDKNLSLKAKGLMSVMLSLPDDWDYSVEGLSQILTEGKDAITSALKELEQYGYLIRTQSQDKQGRFSGYSYDLYENPFTAEPLAENPLTANPPQLNTNIQSTKELNTKDIKENIKEKEIFDFWNSQHIQTHKKLTDEMKKAIDKALKTYSIEDIKTAIQRYGTIYNSNYYWHYQWRLDDFLKQKNALPDFFDDGTKWLNYKNRRKDPKVLHEQEYTQQDYNGVFDTFKNYKIL